MTSPTFPKKSAIWPLAALIAVQVLCTVVFMVDVATDLADKGRAGTIDLAVWPELAACLGLILGIGFEVLVLSRLLREQARMAQGLSVAAGALSDVMAGYFRDWGLTPAEEDVAGFTIKGYSISEIAVLRSSAEGTIKTHLNAIYRKSGTAGRGQLVSILIEDLLQAPILTKPATERPLPAIAAR